MNSYNSISELFAAGGSAMYPLLLCSVLSLSIIIERTIFWFGDARVVSIDRLQKLLAGLDPAKGKPSSSEEALKRSLQAQSYDDAALLLETESTLTFQRATAFLAGLDCVVSVAPLLGILGTVLGIIQAFQKLNLGNGGIPTDVGTGLAEALITTAAGLLIAIPTMVAHSLFTAMARKKAIAIASLADSLRNQPQQRADQEAA
jgi:biopolymer transport protein ExbB